MPALGSDDEPDVGQALPLSLGRGFDRSTPFTQGGFAQEVSPHPVSPLACARGSPTLPLPGRVVAARSVQTCERARQGAGNPASVGPRAPSPSPGGGGSPPSEREAAGWGEFLCKAPQSGEPLVASSPYIGRDACRRHGDARGGAESRAAATAHHHRLRRDRRRSPPRADPRL